MDYMYYSNIWRYTTWLVNSYITCSKGRLRTTTPWFILKVRKNAPTRISCDEEEKKGKTRRTSLVIRGKLFGRSISRRCLCETRASQVGPRSQRRRQRASISTSSLRRIHVFFPKQIMRSSIRPVVPSKRNQTISIGQEKYLDAHFWRVRKSC